MKHYGLLKVVKALGKITTQDFGRKHWQHLGVCESGAADEHAFMWANHLVGNHYNATALEITLGQVEFEFTAPACIVLTGAIAQAKINNSLLPLWCSVAVAAGDYLTISLPKNGLLNYLAINGGFCVKSLCGSSSICEREKIGPFNGECLKVGTFLGYSIGAIALCKRSAPPRFIPNYNSEVLPIIMANNVPASVAAEQQILMSQAFLIDPQSNRMGYRLVGKGLSLPKELYKNASAGVPYGAVQIPPDGQPIVLLKDRQTMGGYPILGCLSRRAGSQIAQCRPGERIKFIAISRQEAALQLQQRNQFFGKRY